MAAATLESSVEEEAAWAAASETMASTWAARGSAGGGDAGLAVAEDIWGDCQMGKWPNCE